MSKLTPSMIKINEQMSQYEVLMAEFLALDHNNPDSHGRLIHLLGEMASLSTQMLAHSARAMVEMQEVMRDI